MMARTAIREVAMPMWDIEVEARATYWGEVEADTEDEARFKAEERGFERDEYFELQDFVVTRVSSQ
jgi:hypothetical protein